MVIPVVVLLLVTQRIKSSVFWAGYSVAWAGMLQPVVAAAMQEVVWMEMVVSYPVSDILVGISNAFVLLSGMRT
jgi:hypothetical protein